MPVESGAVVAAIGAALPPPGALRRMPRPASIHFTLTLTNATQPFFDYGMFRQPERLCRLAPVP